MRLKLLLVTGTLLAPGVVACAPAGDSEPSRDVSASVSTPIDDETEDAARQLAEDWNVTLDEAVVRIRRQGQAVDLADQASRIFGDRFAGAWIDQAHGGAVVIGLTGDAGTVAKSREAAESLATAHGLAGVVDVVGVNYSLDHLTTVLDRLSDQVGETNTGADRMLAISLRVDLNSIEIATPADAALSEAQQRFVDSARIAYGAAVRIVSSNIRPDAAACKYPYCDTPLRGGMRMQSDSGYPCTAGFIVKRLFDNSKWVLTAGHCLYYASFNKPGKPWQLWWTRSADGTERRFGGAGQWWYYGGTAGADYGIISIDSNAENPQPWIWYSDTATNYPITGTATTLLYGYVCKTGAGGVPPTGRQCGFVKSTQTTMTYTDGVTIKHAVTTTMFNCSGDSGGPVYFQGKALGIHSGGSLGSGGCGNTAYYVKIANAQIALAVAIL